MLAATRRKVLVEAHNGDVLAAARSIQALGNVSKDLDTRRKAQRDAEVLYTRYRRMKG